MDERHRDGWHLVEASTGASGAREVQVAKRINNRIVFKHDPDDDGFRVVADLKGTVELKCLEPGCSATF